MRIYENCYELMSELFREVWEMGHIVHPHTMQDKVVKDDELFKTKEITNYSYCLTSLFKHEYLFFAEEAAMKWADLEFIERIDPGYENPGEAWKSRKHIWEEFLDENRRFHYSYNERILMGLDFVIAELKKNPDTRQAIISIWDIIEDIPKIGGGGRVPCSMYYQLMIRNGQLNIIYNQRSADIVTHFGNDVYLAWSLMQEIAQRVGVKPGHLFHNIGSLHSYAKDWSRLKRCIEDIKL